MNPPGYGPDWVKLRGAQGFQDPQGLIWTRDRLHKDHWDVKDARGKKIKEIRFDGTVLWPMGPKNRKKR
jgi:hypothetical protein